MNLSETAYVSELTGQGTFKEGTRFGLRWFTPTLEVNLCGHATLATAKVIFDGVGNPSDTLSFETLSGVLVVTRTAAGGISMDLPKNAPVDETAEKHQALIKLTVGDLPIEACFYSPTTKKLGLCLAPSVNREQLEALRPDTKAMQASTSNAIVTGVMVTMAGATQPGDYDMLSRYFAPWNGIPEDPVTGSAHTVLGPYWRNRLGKTTLKARQCSPRGGDLMVTVEDDGVTVAGSGYIVMSGSIECM
jgi:PhzF family phenazine biosynthesis protein